MAITRKFLMSLCWGVAPLALMAAPSPVLAQDAPQTDSTGGGLDEIIVTARRVDERAQQVPIAITAFSQDNLREKGVNNGTDLQNYTPSLSVVGDVARNQETYSIRGMGGNGGPGTGSGPGVVGYFAEVPTSVSGPGSFYDLASLQVLKGPQGTLFGRNTTGGAVLLEPMRPKMGVVEGYADLTLGNYDRRSGQGALNVPLVDDVLAIRVAGQFDKRDGYVRDVVTGRDYLNRNNYSLRFGLQFNPTEAIRSYTAVSYVDVKEHGGGSILLAVNPARPYAALLQPYLLEQQARGVRETALSVPTREIAKAFLALNNTEFDLSDTLTLKNVISYARTRSTSATDRDSTPLPIADLLGAYPGSYNNNLRTITEELQLRYDDGTLRVQAGGFFLDQTTPSPLTFQTVNPMQQLGILGGGPIILPPALQAALGADTPLLPALSLQPTAHVDGRSKAVYAQVQYELTPDLTATAGFRWTWDRFGGDIQAYQDPQSYQVFNQLAALGVITPAQAAQVIGLNANLCTYDAFQAVAAGGFPTLYYPNCTTPTFNGKSNGPTWQVGLDWQVNPDTLLYVVSRRGYKSGATNPIVSLFLGQEHPLFAVRPEQVTDVELGVKKDWDLGGDAKARTNISAFYTWYNDIQVIQRASIAGSDILTNAEKARVMGLEFEGQLVPVRGLTLSAVYSYNSAKYLKYDSIAIPAIPQALTAAQPSRDLSGTPFSFVPKHKFSLNARIDLPAVEGVGEMAFNANWTYQSSQRVTPEAQPFDTIAGYSLVNLRLEWNNMFGAPIDAAIYGTNIFDKEYRVTANPGYNNSGFINSIYGEPGQYGVQLRYRF
ncbi:TonB-dependent receptor [Sphingopyxis lindanitolerans]|uniref:TonB-dependent receptor n=1 Tax=Sphingopyxis lindanitolerans TaxID=2054227 RepID=A0A2S8B3X1_9SPHN|nr:TonB-dependent receptor [Sphingopyxis lindanitolerans]PQM27102.1 TonB-dependent receptor [Sphingopyxis lindanitolerans]